MANRGKRLMKIQYPYNKELINKLKSILDMHTLDYVVFDEAIRFMIFIDRGKLTWKQVMEDINKVHAVKYNFVNDRWIENGKIYIDCGTINL